MCLVAGAAAALWLVIVIGFDFEFLLFGEGPQEEKEALKYHLPL